MMKTRLSVNINKFATLRNSRGGNIPDLIYCALACEKFGADGITVHPRPDERHIRYNDVRELKGVLSTEFNIEGNPREQKFIDLVTEIRPAQVTLVPDSLSQLTSDHGWDTNKHGDFLREIIGYFKSYGIRTSIFVDPVEQIIRSAKETGTDRIELYTESYAAGYAKDPERAIKPYMEAAVLAQELQLGINAGHDLNLHNLAYFNHHISGLLEVSIGHALVADAIFLGLEECIRRYKACLIETGSEAS